ncbi:hypothetical protein PoB_002009900 [Plakobranchus ocellatus]|uniref:Uncharacterized protein n=1 Tax=Plakobranchus ocellatus TaxID=259542 RepID=A0AAV3ZI82_9GAST|nr:hypothetical protein PoB_002009900 [Plakobranchus ocellatus]
MSTFRDGVKYKTTLVLKSRCSAAENSRLFRQSETTALFMVRVHQVALTARHDVHELRRPVLLAFRPAPHNLLSSAGSLPVAPDQASQIPCKTKMSYCAL